MDVNKYRALVEKNTDKILEVERYIWAHPETGYNEWGTTEYLAKIFEQAGYVLTRPDDITGFYTDIDTGRPGPKILIMGEMDSLASPTHFAAVNGKAHACGHNTQCAALVGVALALKEPGALDGLSGSIRLMAVPAEELIEVEQREKLREKGVIRYLTGKPEYLRRGYMDDVDMAYMVHAAVAKDYTFFLCGANGCITKEITYLGASSHAGGCPEKGINALYAANLGLSAINSLRETFRDDDHVRVHPIITKGGSAVNIIPAETGISTFVRGASMENIAETNRKVNRALAAGALAIGAGVRLLDRPGYAPLNNDPTLSAVAEECAAQLAGRENVNFDFPWECASTDMGDLSCVMPVFHAHVAGSDGTEHGDNYCVTDPMTCCVLSAAFMTATAGALLCDGAAKAKEVVAKAKPKYKSKEEYFAAIDAFSYNGELISYDDKGAIVKY